MNPVTDATQKSILAHLVLNILENNNLPKHINMSVINNGLQIM